jgi:hypothetical protein
MKKLILVLLLIPAAPVYGVKLIPNGATSQSISVVIVDSDGDPNANVTVTDLDLYVQKDGAGAQSTKIDLVALASADTAWTSGRAIHKGNGSVRIDVPDANLSDGAGVLLTYIIDDGGTSNDTAFYEVQLVQPDFFTSGLSEYGDKLVADIDANSLLVNLTAARAGYLDNINNALLTELGLSEIGQKVVADIDANSTAVSTATMRTNVWTAALASYDVEDSVGNVLNDFFAEDGTDGIYYMATLDEDKTTIDLDGTTISARLDATSVDLVWDELLSGHTTVGSAGEALFQAATIRRY